MPELPREQSIDGAGTSGSVSQGHLPRTCASPSTESLLETQIVPPRECKPYNPHFPEHYRSHCNLWVNILWHAWTMIRTDFDNNIYSWARSYALPAVVLEAFVSEQLFCRSNDIEVSPIERYIEKLEAKPTRRRIPNPFRRS